MVDIVQARRPGINNQKLFAQDSVRENKNPCLFEVRDKTLGHNLPCIITIFRKYLLARDFGLTLGKALGVGSWEAPKGRGLSLWAPALLNNRLIFVPASCSSDPRTCRGLEHVLCKPE